MSWLVVGITCGWCLDLCSVFLMDMYDETPDMAALKNVNLIAHMLVYAVIFGVFCVPTIGGFVVVASMLRDYGVCDSA